MAALYDALNPWGPGDDHYLDLVRSARSVLDLGCGTGLLLRTAAADGHPGVLVGVDLAAAMLDEARRHGASVEWVLGDARSVDVGRRFELVTMTGHAFQALPTDDDLRALLANVRRHLEPGGRFAFETRNPAARAWERWDGATRVRSREHEGVVVALESARPVAPDLVELTGSFRFESEAEPIVSTGTLRFLDPALLRGLLAEAGFAIDGWFGDWDRSPVTFESPEIVVLASVGGSPGGGRPLR